MQSPNHEQQEAIDAAADALNPFGKVIYAYTRRQALADGQQVDVSETAREAGIVFACYLTRAVWLTCVVVPDGVRAQDERGRLWDVVWMTRHAIRTAPNNEDGEPLRKLAVSLYVRNTNRAAKLVSLRAVCGPVDMDDPRPAITIMLPDED